MRHVSSTVIQNASLLAPAGTAVQVTCVFEEMQQSIWVPAAANYTVIRVPLSPNIRYFISRKNVSKALT